MVREKWFTRKRIRVCPTTFLEKWLQNKWSNGFTLFVTFVKFLKFGLIKEKKIVDLINNNLYQNIRKKVKNSSCFWKDFMIFSSKSTIYFGWSLIPAHIPWWIQSFSVALFLTRLGGTFSNQVETNLDSFRCKFILCNFFSNEVVGKSWSGSWKKSSFKSILRGL